MCNFLLHVKIIIGQTTTMNVNKFKAGQYVLKNNAFSVMK